jgi:hypothetical protein
MRRSDAGKHLRTHGRWMRPSERIVFLILLERSDNTDCSVPAWITPSLAQLADAAGCTVSTTAEALSHLEKHGWLTRARSKGGRGQKSGYQLTAGQPCGAASPASCLRPPKQSDGSDSLTEKQSDGSEQKQSDGSWSNRRSNAVSDVGHRRGRVKKDPALCLVCHLVMDPVLPPAGFSTHPCCDPYEVSPLWPAPYEASQ